MRKVLNPVHATDSIEFFGVRDPKYDEISLIDCNDSFTHNLVQAFMTLRAPVRTFRLHEVTEEDILANLGSYLVLSPGPGKPSEVPLVHEIYQQVFGKLPILGVCLGMQVINEVHGGKTKLYEPPVHGKVSSITHNQTSVFRGIPNPIKVARYHSLRIEVTDPKIEVLSTYEQIPMALKIAPKTIGVQFHPESFMTEYGEHLLLNFLEGHL